MRKLVTVTLSLSLLLTALTGCSCRHTWAEASCTTPKTCTLCGEIEGDALGHVPVQANFQTGGLCSTCGEIVTEPLTPAFEERNVQGYYIDADKEYNYVTHTYNGDFEVVDKLMVTDYTTEPADKEGYEVKTVSLTIKFDDKRIPENGILYEVSCEDYYDFEAVEQSIQYPPRDYSQYKFTVNWNGEDYECSGVRNPIVTNAGSEFTFTQQYTLTVPAGYDGMTVVARDGAMMQSKGKYIDELTDKNTLIFRMD